MKIRPPLSVVFSAFLFAITVAGSVISPLATSPAGASSPALTLPIAVDDLSSVHWTDTWGAARSGGRSHVGVDMMGPKHTPLVAAADGVISWMRHSSSQGNILYLTDDNGWQYTYIHINNDTPGTDDGANSYSEAFGPGIEEGVRVSAGQVVAYMGDSGNAEWTGSHLHFEVVDPNGNNVNPAPLVDAARDRALNPITVDAALVSPFDSFDSFAEELYQTVYGRSALHDERQELATILTAGGTDTGLADALDTVIDPRTPGASVDRLYEAYFLRTADTTGINYWMDQYRSGASITDIADWFAASDEFQNRYAGQNFGDFLDQLYEDVLNRPPDTAGKSYWLNLLNTGQVSKGTIVVQFTESNEMILSTERRTELTMLSLLLNDRTPSAALTDQWESLRSGSSLQASLQAVGL